MFEVDHSNENKLSKLNMTLFSHGYIHNMGRIGNAIALKQV